MKERVENLDLRSFNPPSSKKNFKADRFRPPLKAARLRRGFRSGEKNQMYKTAELQ